MEVSILRDGFIAFLAAVGLVGLTWTLAGVLVRRARRSAAACIVLRLEGDARGLDWAVYAACRMAPELGRETRVVLLDCGLSDAGRQRAAFWEESNSCVTVLTPSQIEEFIT